MPALTISSAPGIWQHILEALQKSSDVVDSNLKTHLDNLFVCDCSVIPLILGDAAHFDDHRPG